MFEIIAIILCVLTLILLLSYLYQRHQINDLAETSERPFPSYEYDFYIGKYCPEGYRYMGISQGTDESRIKMDKCKSNNDTQIFPLYKNLKDWPPKKNNNGVIKDPGLKGRCDLLNNNSNWSWDSISNLCAFVK